MKHSIRPLQFIISGVVLFHLYHRIPLDDIGSVLSQASISLLAIAAIVTLVPDAVGALRVKVLTDNQGFSLPISKLLEINLITHFYKLLFPGGVVATLAVRFYKLQKAERLRTAALSVMVVDRISVTLGLCAVGVVCWVARRSSDVSYLGWINVVALFGALLLTAIVLCRWDGWAARRLFAWPPFSFAERPVNTWRCSVTLYRELSVGELGRIALYAVLPQILGTLVFALLGAAIGLSIDLMSWGWIRATIMLLTMIPISLAGLGIREGALLVILPAYGVAAEDVLALGLLVFAVTVVFTAILGGLIEARALQRPIPSRTPRSG